MCESVPTSVSQNARPSGVANDQPGQVLEIHLVADARPGGHRPEAVEGALGPAEQLVALDVALVLDGDVLVIGRGVAGTLDDDGVVDDQLHRDQGVDLGRVAPEARQGIAHGGQVDHAGNPGEVLHEDPLGGQGDLVRRVTGALPVRFGVGAPGGDGDDVVGRDVGRVLVPEQVLQDHLDRVGEAAHLMSRDQGRSLEGEDLVLAALDRQDGPGAEAVGVGRGRGS